MELVNELFTQMSELEDNVSLIQALEEYIELAVDDAYYYQLLVDLATLFGLRGYVDFKSAILTELWQIDQQVTVGMALAQHYYDLGYYYESLQLVQSMKAQQASDELLLLEAKNAQQIGDERLQKQLLQQIIKTSPTNVDAYYLLAQLHERQKDVAKAVELYDVIINYFAQSVYYETAVLNKLALLLNSEVVDYQAIHHLLSEMGKQTLNNPAMLLLMARGYQMLQLYEQSNEYAQQVRQIDADNFDSVLILLANEIALNHHEDAKTLLAWLTRNLPPFDELIREVVFYAEQLASLNDALIEQLQNYLLLVDDLSDYLYEIALITDYYFAQQQTIKLADFLNQMTDTFESVELLSYSYAKLYELQADFAETESYYLDALELALNIPHLVMAFAQFYRQNELVDKADELLAEYAQSSYIIEES